MMEEDGGVSVQGIVASARILPPLVAVWEVAAGTWTALRTCAILQRGSNEVLTDSGPPLDVCLGATL